MSVKFKCKHTGNVFEFFHDHDIKTMREHSEYEEVKPVEIVQNTEEVPTKRNVGRPRSKATEE